jgi:hypothetical protein
MREVREVREIRERDEGEKEMNERVVKEMRERERERERERVPIQSGAFRSSTALHVEAQRITIAAQLAPIGIPDIVRQDIADR